MIRWRALSLSLLVNIAGLTASIWPLPRETFWSIGMRQGFGQYPADGPALYVVASRRADARLMFDSLLEEPAVIECPGERVAESDAEPAFPLLSTGRPFAWLDPAADNPAFCVRIGRNGRVATAYVFTSSGDPATDQSLLGSVRRLRFIAARHRGRPVASWQRLIVGRAAGASRPFLDIQPDAVLISRLD